MYNQQAYALGDNRMLIREFSRRALTRDLLVGPGDDFGCPGYFRVCYCVKHDTIVRSLPIFRQLIKEYKEEAR